MTNEQLKSKLGWFIIGSQLALLVTAFLLHANDSKLFGETERAAIFGSVLPPLTIYGTAAVSFMLQDPNAARKHWQRQKATRNRIAVTLLLPPIPFLMTIFLIIFCLYGKISRDGLANGVVLIQTVQSAFVTLIYSWFFKEEIQSLGNQTRPSGPGQSNL